MRYRRFILYDSIAAAIGISVNLWVVHFFGPEIDLAIATLKRTGRTFLVIGVLVLLFTAFFIFRRRRLAKEEEAIAKSREPNERNTSLKPPASAEGLP